LKFELFYSFCLKQLYKQFCISMNKSYNMAALLSYGPGESWKIYRDAKNAAFSTGSKIKSTTGLFFPAKTSAIPGGARERMEDDDSIIKKIPWANPDPSKLGMNYSDVSSALYFDSRGSEVFIQWDKIDNQTDFYRALAFTHGKEKDGKYFFDPEYHTKCILTAEKDTKEFLKT
jgi:hypothetical protein